LLLAALSASLISLCITRIADFDVWWHLRTGRWIFDHRTVPHVDIFSYTIAGRRWVTFEWLSQILSYLLFSIAGPAGLTLFKTGVIWLTFLFIALYGGTRRAADAPALTVVLAIAAWGGRSSFVERPQIFTFLFTALYLLILKRAEEKPSRLWVLPFLQILWTNLHGGASVLGLALIAAWLLGSSLPRRLGLVLLLCAAASLVNPNGWAIYSQLFGTMSFAGRSAITEWLPLRYTASFVPIWLPLLALELLSAAVWLANPARRTGEALLWGAFFVLPFRALRFATQATLFFAQIAVGNLARLLESWRPERRTLAAAAVATLIVVLGGTWTYEKYAFPGVFTPGLGVAHDAKDAIAFMQKSNLKGNLFNSYELGGEVLWYAPGRPDFVDGRSLEYGAEFIDDAVNWFHPQTWQKLDGRYHFQIALILNGDYYLCGILDEDPRWTLVYWDDVALLYVRNDGENTVVAKRGYHFLKPNQVDNYYLENVLTRGGASAAAVLDEADRSIAAAPGHVNPRLMKAYLLLRLNRPQNALAEADAAIRLAPDRAETYYEDALILQSLGRLDEARSRYLQCLRAANRFGNTGLAAQTRNQLAGLRTRSIP